MTMYSSGSALGSGRPALDETLSALTHERRALELGTALPTS
jgi:hypothetical protein